jgi:hypothetical protein
MTQVNGVNYNLEDACRELERLTAQVDMLKALNEGYSAADRSADDVYHMALQDMSAQLQTAVSERAACQTALLKLQECDRMADKAYLRISFHVSAILLVIN